MQKTRAKIVKPPKKFFDFLEVVNSIGNEPLPSYAVLMEAYRLIFYAETGSEGEAIWKAREQIETILTDTIKKHPAFCKFIFGKSPDEEITTDDFWSRGVHLYGDFRIDREIVVNAAHALATERESYPDGMIFINETSTRVIVGIDQKTGLLVVQNYEFKNFKNLDLRRFKICPVCKDIFWSFRSDKKACDKCSNIYRQKVFQDKNREEINEKRRATYQQNKKVKKIKNKNGTL